MEPHRPMFPLVRLAGAAALAAALLACGGDRPVAVISVSGLWPGLRALRVTASAGEQHARTEVQQDLSQFALLLPDGASGTLIVTIEADEAGCTTGSGAAAAEIAGARVDLTVALIRLPVRAGAPGWCWESVVPPEDAFAGVWGASPRQLWAVANSSRGGPSSILRWDDGRWSTVHRTEAMTTLDGIWGSGPADVWAHGGDGAGSVLLRWDGVAWSRSEAPEAQGRISAMWGTAADQVFGVGSAGGMGAIFRFDGAGWRRVLADAPGPLRDVCGTAPDQAFAVGAGPDSGFVYGWDGAAWTQRHSVPMLALGSVFCASREQAWAAGSSTQNGAGAVLLWNGTAWGPVGITAGALRDLWGAGPGDVWTVGAPKGDSGVQRWNGTSWAQVETGATTGMTAIWGSSPGDVWVMTDSGFALRWVGGR